jgi:tetratricopeptide (TPR) repeat protein
VYRVDEAIPQLAGFVAISIAIGARTNDLGLLVMLPPLLQPFAPLSPLLEALWQNTLGTAEGFECCHYERARERWIEVLAKLEQLRGSEIPHLDEIRNAIAYGIGALEAFFGIASAADRVAELDRDPYQQVSALYIRKVVRLEQGDWAGAEKFRREAEVLALRAHIPPMFTTLTVEISAHAYARDLAGVKDVIDRERIEAARYPGWVPYLREAEARFELARGDYAAAKARYDRMGEWSTIDEHGRSETMPVWVAAQGGMCEALLGLGLAAEAQATARAALSVCAKNDIHLYAYELERMLAFAEAKLGDFESANARLDRVIAAQTALGTTGLRIGINYEARAEIALWNADPVAFDQFARHTAREYRHGAGSPLGVRYERLMHEARRRGIARSAKLSDFRPSLVVDGGTIEPLDPQSAISVGLAGASGPEELHQRALRLLCSMRSARGGYMYLTTSDGPQLVATFDLPPPGRGLREYVASYLSEQEDSFETKTVGVVDSIAETSSANTRIDETEYELLPLRCVHDDEPLSVGVIVLVPGARQLINPYQLQLVAAIAQRLVESR